MSYYFNPDLSAGSFRNTALVHELAKYARENISIHVITTQPNRYKSFSDQAPKSEKIGNVTIDRVKVPPHSNGFIDQIRSYLVYYARAMQLVVGKYDIVYASSSRLFTAYLGKRIASRKDAVLYLDIRDIFVETMDEVLKKFSFGKKWILKIIHQFVEKPTFRSAAHINLVSEGFMSYFKEYSQANYSFFPNGIDDAFMNITQKKNLPERPKIITYAGNIGEGQGLEKIIPEAAQLLGDDYFFQVIGDGGTRKLLENKIKKLNLSNVKVYSPVKRDKILQIYRESHYLFLHLNDYKAFEKVLPSKLFEYAASNIPVIAGVAGHSAKFVEENIDNYILFKPCQVEDFVAKLKSSTYYTVEREEFKNKYSRKRITQNLVQSIISYL